MTGPAPKDGAGTRPDVDTDAQAERRRRARKWLGRGVILVGVIATAIVPIYGTVRTGTDRDDVIAGFEASRPAFGMVESALRTAAMATRGHPRLQIAVQHELAGLSGNTGDEPTPTQTAAIRDAIKALKDVAADGTLPRVARRYAEDSSERLEDAMDPEGLRWTRPVASVHPTWNRWVPITIVGWIAGLVIMGCGCGILWGERDANADERNGTTGTAERRRAPRNGETPHNR